MPQSLTLLRKQEPIPGKLYLVRKASTAAWFVLRLEKVGDSLRWIDHRNSVVLYAADDVIFEAPEGAYERELVVTGGTTK